MKKELDEILQICSESDISIFDGEFDNENQQQTVSWTNEEEQSYLKFITIIKRTGAKILIVSSSESELEINSLNEIDRFNNIPSDEKEYAKHLFNEVNQNRGDLLYYSLSIIINSTIYNFTKFANWYASYFELTNLIEGSRDIDLEEKRDENRTELISYGRKLANTPLFQKSRNKSLELQQ